jgi:hypothetical protein
LSAPVTIDDAIPRTSSLSLGLTNNVDAETLKMSRVMSGVDALLT